MDRRQRKTRTAIFDALTALLSEKSFGQITVGQIIARADIGRATFYAHFETKEELLRALCEDLFDHILDAAAGKDSAHSHLFDCEAPDSVFLHLLQHLQKNDHHILDLLSSQNDELFLQYFKAALRNLAVNQLPQFAHRKAPQLPEDFFVDHIAATFVETVRWWLKQDRSLTPEQMAEYFYLAV